MRSIILLLILVMIGLNGKGQSVTALPDSVLSQCCLEVTLLNGNVTTVDWVFIQYITRDGTGTKLFVEYAPNFGGIQWETQIRIQDDFDDVIARSKFIILPFTVGSTDYGINRNWIANIEENTTTGGTWIYGRFGTPAKRKFSAVEDYETMKNLLLACRPRAIIVAENGLYTEGDTVRMGGFLIEPTKIRTEGYNWQMKDNASSVEFGIDYSSPWSSDTVVYWAKRTGKYRHVMEMGDRYWANVIEDTTGAQFYGRLEHSWDTGINSPALRYTAFDLSGLRALLFSITLDDGFRVTFTNDATNPVYTPGLIISDSQASLGVNESGSLYPGNGPQIGVIGYGAGNELVFIKTKKVDDVTASVGQFLQLKDLITGEVEFATIDLSGYLEISDTAAMLDPYVQGAGTINRVPIFTGSRVIGNSNIQDNNTAISILNSKPFSLGQWTTAGRPTGVNGYGGFNTSTNWVEYYSSTGWFSPHQSALNGGLGTSGSIFFSDANGRITQDNANFYFDDTNNRLALKTNISGYMDQTITMYGTSEAIRFQTSSNNGGTFGLWFNNSTNGGIAASKLVASPTGANGRSTLQFWAASSGNATVADINWASDYLNNYFYKPIIYTLDDFTIGDAVQTAGDAVNYWLQHNNGQKVALRSKAFGALGEGSIQLVTNDSVRVHANARGGNVSIGFSETPLYSLHVIGTNAIGLPRGTVAQRPTIVSSTTPFRYNTDSTALEYGESVGIWRLLATRAYARSLAAGAADGNGIISALPLGNVSIATNTNTLTLNGSSLTLQNQGGFNAFTIKGNTDYEGTIIQTQKTFTYFTQLDRGNTFLPGQYRLKHQIAHSSLGGGDHVINIISLDTTTNVVRNFQGSFFGSEQFAQQFSVSSNISGVPGFRILKNDSGTTGNLFEILSTSGTTFSNSVRADGMVRWSRYGGGSMEAADLSKTQSNYIAGFATDGTVLDLEFGTGLAISGGKLVATATAPTQILAEEYYTITSTSSPQALSSTNVDNLINQGGTQASFTLDFPASPVDGQRLTITYNNNISSLTLNGNGNSIIGTAVTTAVAGSQRVFKFYTGIGWIRQN